MWPRAAIVACADADRRCSALRQLIDARRASTFREYLRLVVPRGAPAANHSSVVVAEKWVTAGTAREDVIAWGREDDALRVVRP